MQRLVQCLVRCLMQDTGVLGARAHTAAERRVAERDRRRATRVQAEQSRAAQRVSAVWALAIAGLVAELWSCGDAGVLLPLLLRCC